MNYFEKLFLGTTLLFGIVIMFVLGLYFDLGDVFSSSIEKRGYVTRGTAVDRLVDRMDVKRRTTDKKPSSGNTAFGHVPRVAPSVSLTRNSIAQRFRDLYGRKKKKGEERVEQYRKYLMEQGFTNGDFIAMKALAQDKSVSTKALRISRRLSASGEYEEAVNTLIEAMEQLDEKDLEQRRKLASSIAQIALRGGMFDEARVYTKKQIELQRSILAIEANCKLMEQRAFSGRVNSELATLSQKEAQVDRMFSSMEKRKEETGKYTGLFAEEKVALKAEALGLRSKGEISKEMYTRMLSVID